MVSQPSPDGRTVTLAFSRALGCSEVRSRILRRAFDNGYCTAAGLMTELGISRSALTSQIRPLVAAGLLIPETDPNNTNLVGGRNRRRWRVDAHAFDVAMDEFHRAMTGRP
jgi:DNA-binding MarR family transcriptional regulator